MTDYTYETLLVEIDDGLAILTLNLPETGNAINGVMHDELAAVLYALNADHEVRAIVMTGAGGAFCAGGDATYIRDLEPAEFDEVFLTVRLLMQNMLALDKPLIAALNGATVGVGATLAVYSDIIIGAAGAHIADPHVQFGLAAGDGGALMWALQVGFPIAKYHLMTGDPLSMERAAEIGLINEVLPASEVLARATEIGRRLADGPGPAIRGTKRIFNKIAEVIGAGVLEFAAGHERAALHSEDHKEAVAAYFENRDPVFRNR